MIFDVENTAHKKVTLRTANGVRVPYPARYDTETCRAEIMCVPTVHKSQVPSQDARYEPIMAELGDQAWRIVAGRLSATLHKKVVGVEVVLPGATIEVDGVRY